MTTDKRPMLSEAELDALLNAAAAEPVAGPSEALMQRIMADAAENRPRPVIAAPAAKIARRGLIAYLLDQIGGVPAATGLAMVGLAGLMIGYADTSLINSAGQAIGLEAADYDIGDLYAEFSGLGGGG